MKADVYDVKITIKLKGTYQEGKAIRWFRQAVEENVDAKTSFVPLDAKGNTSLTATVVLDDPDENEFGFTRGKIRDLLNQCRERADEAVGQERMDFGGDDDEDDLTDTGPEDMDADVEDDEQPPALTGDTEEDLTDEDPEENMALATTANDKPKRQTLHERMAQKKRDREAAEDAQEDDDGES